MALHEHPAGLRISELAEELHVDASVASRQAASVAAEQLIERRIDATDRRAFRLHLTDAGRTRLNETLATFTDAIAPHLRGWTDPELDELSGALHRLHASIESPHASTHAPSTASPSRA